MNPHRRELLDFLRTQKQDSFSIAGRIDERRYLGREFPAELPLLLSLQSYPRYQHMVGENWMHWHDYYEMWVATSGHGEYQCGNHRFTFAPGDVVLVDPLKIHGVLSMDKAHAPLVVFFRAEAVAPGGAAIDLDFLSTWDRRSEKLTPRLSGDAVSSGPVLAALLHLAQTWFQPAAAEGRALTLRFHLLEVLLELRRAFSTARTATPETLPMRADREARLARVLEYVAEHGHKHLAQPDVARVAGMSTSRFRAFFKETTGWGFADYLRDLRLERAARLLRETGESVAEVAYQTGFADQSHLQRLFKAKTGISPLAYRKQHQAAERPVGKIAAR